MAKSKYTTGFCGVGLHEGTKPKTKTGVPMKVCDFWIDCKCHCHAQITKMHEMTETERVPHQNPDYNTPKGHYVMPRPDEVGLLKVAEVAVAEPVIRNPLEAPAKRFDATPTGKRARGQLEDEVLAVCGSFVRGELPYEVLTPKDIAYEIDKFDQPSVGAIGAVFDRWVTLGFAKVEKRPVQFVSFTLEGMMHGLDYLKAKHKRDAKLKQGNADRTLRPKR